MRASDERAMRGEIDQNRKRVAGVGGRKAASGSSAVTHANVRFSEMRRTMTVESERASKRYDATETRNSKRGGTVPRRA
jgi:hypothetical protein